ncbi:MAG: hypothetical protein M0R03_23025, partial [Novosphingobium sp.]|nr:hypothetical protein [Novosphingobium sp.]
MSHYTVVVFNEEEMVDELLAPYDERLDVAWYKHSDLSDKERELFLGWVKEEYPHPVYAELSLRELYRLY